MNEDQRKLQQQFVQRMLKTKIISRFDRSGCLLRTIQGTTTYKSWVSAQGNSRFIHGQAVHSFFVPQSLLDAHVSYWMEFAPIHNICSFIFKPECQMVNDDVISLFKWHTLRTSQYIVIAQTPEDLEKIQMTLFRISNWIHEFTQKEPLAHLSWEFFGHLSVEWHGTRIESKIQFLEDDIEMYFSGQELEPLRAPLTKVEDAFEQLVLSIKKKYRLPNLMNPTYHFFKELIQKCTRNEAIGEILLTHLQQLGVTHEQIESWALLELRKPSAIDLPSYKAFFQPLFSFAILLGPYYIHISAKGEWIGEYDVICSDHKEEWIKKSSERYAQHLQENLTIYFKPI